MQEKKRPVGVLPPAGDPPNVEYKRGLQAAMEGLSLAIKGRLQDRGDDFRFQDVVRMGKIGQALQRQLARGDKSVDAYVNPQRRNQFACMPGVNMGYAGLGGLDDDDPFRDDVGPVPFGGPGVMANPMQPGGAGFDAGNPFAPLNNVLQGLQDQKEMEAKSNRRLDALRELKDVKKMLAEEGLSEEETQVLEERRGQLLAEIKVTNKETAEGSENLERIRQRAKETEDDELIVRCLNRTCGNAHDADWVTEEGEPRRCDICNGPMCWAPGAAPAEDEIIDAEVHEVRPAGPAIDNPAAP